MKTEASKAIEALTPEGGRYNIVNLEEPVKSVVMSIYEGEWVFTGSHKDDMYAGHKKSGQIIELAPVVGGVIIQGEVGLTPSEYDALNKAFSHMYRECEKNRTIVKFNKILGK